MLITCTIFDVKSFNFCNSKQSQCSARVLFFLQTSRHHEQWSKTTLQFVVFSMTLIIFIFLKESFVLNMSVKFYFSTYSFIQIRYIFYVLIRRLLVGFFYLDIRWVWLLLFRNLWTRPKHTRTPWVNNV